jgi:site-specific DNA-adenine methylase
MSYRGGKNGAGVFQTIICEIPPHEIYIEPFLGHGAVLRHKRPALQNLGLDIDADVVAWWQRWQEANSRLGFKIVQQDAFSFLKSLQVQPRTFIYCDPPYPISARAQQREIYQHELTDDDHRELLSLLLAMGARSGQYANFPTPMIAISSYANGIYQHMLKDWRTIEFQSCTRSGRMATETLWMNYPAPARLHDYHFLGETYRERERIRKMQQRWRGKLTRLSALERQAMMQLLTEVSSRAEV